MWLVTILEMLLQAVDHRLANRSHSMTWSNVFYRTKDGRADYQFSIERQSDGTYRVFIISQPSYGDRSTGAYETHRLTAGGRRYVCWNQPLGSQEDAMSVAALWADATQRYIKSGRRF
jgi:hypothetical protein